MKHSDISNYLYVWKICDPRIYSDVLENLGEQYSIKKAFKASIKTTTNLDKGQIY